MENLAFEQRDSGLYKAILSASVKSVALLPRSKESFNRNYTINYLAQQIDATLDKRIKDIPVLKCWVWGNQEPNALAIKAKYPKLAIME